MLITLVELSLPYLTKIAIDRHIIPDRQLSKAPPGMTGESNKNIRYIKIRIQNEDIDNIVNAHHDKFKRVNGEAFIPYDDYVRLSKKELSIIHKKDFFGLGVISGVFLILIFFNFLLNFFQVMVMEYMGQKMMHDLRIKLYNHIQSLSISFFQKIQQGGWLHG